MKPLKLFSLFLIVGVSKTRTVILDKTTSMTRVRRLALALEKSGRKWRKIEIECNGKVLPGGARALDDEVYALTLEAMSKEVG